MSSAPPPLPMGGPPPALPLPGGPPPIPVGGLPPPGGMGMSHPPPSRGRGRSPFTNTLLITNLPSFFVGYQQVRDWLYPCGTAKTCIFYPRPPKRKNDKEEHNKSAKKDKEEGENNAPPLSKKQTVLVNMINPDHATKVVASFRLFSDKLDDRYKDIRCYMVPSSPDVPLPPPLLDEASQKILGEKLWQNFVSLETSHAEVESKPGSEPQQRKGAESGGKAGTDAPGASATGNAGSSGNDGDEPKLLDADKAAAAAGGAGAYDADEDPLNAPQVLEAVKEFRRKLGETHGSQKSQRSDAVARKLAELRPRIRARVDAERKGAVLPLRAPPLPTSLPQPPLPQPRGGTGPPPPPPALGLPPPPRAAVADSGKRGRSNLPAWMTQQQQQTQPPPAGDGPAASKRARTEGHPSHFPSNLPPSTHALLRQFLANKVKESMGEEEATLIDFLYTHILKGKATSELLQELQVVLDDEADGFLNAVWAKVQEIQQQQ